MQNEKLSKIAAKYATITFNEDNYYIGGGLDGKKFASNRHEDAKYDEGKLTEGQATQLFKKATCLDLDLVKSIINYAVPNMEWHHAGKLPKGYGGGMKKTYFLNAKEICDLATNWEDYLEKYSISIEQEKTAAQRKKELEEKKLLFLQANGKKVERIKNKPIFFYQTAQEMEGKYGWFDSTYKSYNLPEYFSGWEFESEEKYHEFFNLI